MTDKRVMPPLGDHVPWPQPDALSPTHANLIRDSWLRSEEAGLSKKMAPDFSGTSAQNVKGLLDQHQQLAHLAYPVVQMLHEQIANTHSMVILSDSVGQILYSMGDDSFLDRAERVALKPGVDWSEGAKGTNAIGTSLALKKSVVVHGDQHYLEVNRVLTCSSTPILGPQGGIIGALDVTGDARGYYHHTIALARMSAQIIENKVFAEAYHDTIRIHFHSRPEFIGTLFEGLVAVSLSGRVLAANRCAVFQIGKDLSALQQETLTSLFGVSINDLIDRFRTNSGQLISLNLPNGVTVQARTEMRVQTIWHLQPNAAPTNPAKESTTGTSHRKEHPSNLHYLDTGDAQVASVIQKLRRVQGREIPIMILGETGVGKELLAKAIHNDSNRSKHPFIAVNCASIPESLIEAELFGYEEGAFTGARRKGAVGKLLMANGGTLFLDEIGDMPLSLQTRLLRAIQERVITPLGSNRSIPVDFAVISATHRNLRQMVSSGQFREDLFYRLNGLAVKLPALRERTDLDAIIRHLLLHTCEDGKPKLLCPDVHALFASYNWPGNVRQLGNVLRTACVLADGDPTICLEHLPDDFIEEARHAQAAPAPVPAAQPFMASAPAAFAPAFAPANPAPTGDYTSRAWSAKGLQEVEIEAIHNALSRCNGNVSAAARMLGVSRNTIYRKLPDLAQKKALDQRSG